MSNARRIYLDNAATSWPKPLAVYEAVDDYQRRLGVAVGRGGYAEAEEVGQAVAKTRAAVARLIGAENPERVVFTFNGTDSLNLGIHGILNPGDHVITTVVEHNSVLRPLRRLEKRHQIEVTRVGCDAVGVIDPEDIRAALRPETKLIVVTHASNVTGAIQPVSEVSRIARERGVLFLVDAAQTVGHLAVSVADIGADLLAAPGHKGLLGPLGTGILYIRPGVEQLMESIRQGGTGSSSSSDEQPDSLPEKYESGNHNAPGIVGLGAGLKYIEERGIENIRQQAVQLTDLLLSGLATVPGIEIFGPRRSDTQIGVVSVSLANRDAPSVAKRLEREFGVRVRAGFQCAALMHCSLGTLDRRGTVRFSIGPFNTSEDIAAAVTAVVEIAKSIVEPVATINCPCASSDERNARPYAAVTPAHTNNTSTPQSSRPTDIAAFPGLQELWNETLGDPEIRIAVLDGPVDMTHPSLKDARLTTLREVREETAKVGAASFHGTHVASVIFADHSGPLRGIAPNCSGLVRPIFTDGPDGVLLASSQEQVAQALHEAVKAGAHIINISGGEPSPHGEAEPALARAIQECEEQRVLVVAAAGNGDCPGLHACNCMHVPAALSTVVAVGAMDEYGQPLSFSNCGSGYAQHGLLAPGARMLGATPGNTTSESTGTSYAAPVVTGVAALLLSLQKKLGLKVDSLAVRDALLKSSDPCDPNEDANCQRILGGRLNIPRAVSLITQGIHSMTSDPELLPTGCGCHATSPPMTTPNEEEERNVPAPDRNGLSGNGESIAPSVFSRQQQPVMSSSVMPSSCIADSIGQLVYVIGKLAFDFGTTGNRDSLQNNIPTHPGLSTTNPLQITDAFGLLAYLLGYRVRISDKKQGDPGKKQGDPKLFEVCGNLHDAAYVTWVLTQNNCPKYVVRPQGAYEEAGYLELIRFLIEQNDFRRYLHMPGCDDGNKNQEWSHYDDTLEFQLRGDCLKQYYCCHGGVVCPCGALPDADEKASDESTKDKPTRGDALFEQSDYKTLALNVGLEYSAAEYIALAGELCGTKRLFNGSLLQVISPAMRSSASWNTISLVAAVEKASKRKLQTQERTFLLSMIFTLAEHVLNDGITPEERAFNFASTQVIETLSALIRPNSVFLQVVSDHPGPTQPPVLSVGFDGWSAVPAKCKDVDTLPYDVTLIFYNVNSLRPSRVFVTFTINVADVNPVGQPARISVRR